MIRLQLENISKTFPGVQALDNIHLALNVGEIHALCGENGAGKSTMINILAGNLQPDSGTISISGVEENISKPKEAFAFGIAIVYQHLSLIDNLSVAENIYANQQPANKWGIIQFNELHKKTKSLLQQLHLDEIDPKTMVARLSPAEKQMVEIAKALSKNPSIFILDEPTASLTDKETRTLFTILKTLKDQGVSIIYVSHRLEEIFQLADRITILKDGKYQGTFPTPDITHEQLINRMVGREIAALKKESHVREEVLLDVTGLSGKRFSNVSFQLKAGEIVGIAGLVGAGRTELARAIFGADEVISGRVVLKNKEFKPSDPSNSISHGLVYVPEERKSLGLFQEMTVKDNIISGKLKNAVEGNLYSHALANSLAEKAKDKLKIVTPNVEQKVVNLSGGNQQKVVLAKWLLTNPDILIVDEPTHGIDVGAKFEIYGILKGLAAEGKGIIMISSDLPELLGISDRILIMKRGNIAGTLSRSEATEEKIMSLASN
jgi:ribose transport system ATP-binding protein